MKEIYNDYCIQILEDQGRYFLRYNDGTIATQIQEIEITYNDAQYIMSLNSAIAIRVFMSKSYLNKLKNARIITPNEYVGNTIKLIMG